MLLRRQNERSSSNTFAVIRNDDASFTTSCVVRNLSQGGAKLMVEEGESLPPEFILLLRPSSPFGRRCQTIWRIGNRLGVRFVSVADFSRREHKGSGIWAPG